MKLPKDYWEIRLDQVKPTGALHLRVVTKYIKLLHEMVDSGWGLLFYGPNDMGKTALAALVLMEARRWGYYGLFVRAEALRIASIKDIVFDDTHTLVERARLVPVLVIDDLGKEHRGQSGHAERFIEDLVRERISEQLPTIITTNMDKVKLKDVYSASFAHVVKSRIYPCPVNGYNYREAQAEQMDGVLGDA